LLSAETASVWICHYVFRYPLDLLWYSETAYLAEKKKTTELSGGAETEPCVKQAAWGPTCWDCRGWEKGKGQFNSVSVSLF